MTTERPGFPWVLTVLTALGLIILVALGTWQVNRLGWKQDLIARAEAAAARPPVPAATLAGPGEDPEFRRVSLTCPGLAAAPFVELRTIEEGQAGVRLVSACRDSGRTWLVDRGFVADEVVDRPAVSDVATPVQIEGVLRRPSASGAFTPEPAGRTFYGRDPEAMAAVLGAPGPVVPLTVYLTASSSPDGPAVRPSAPPPAFSNNHLGYAATWYGLALVLAGMWIAFVMRRRRR